MGRAATRIVAGLCAVAALCAGGLWLFSGYVLNPPWYPGVSPDGTLPVVDNQSWNGAVSNPLDAFGLACQDVAFPAEDGQTLRGWYLADADRPASAALVLVHGGGGDRRDYLRHLPLFRAAGWPVLLFDCREHGASDGRGVGMSFAAREHRDVSSAVAWLRETHGFERIGVLGTSQGGASVILAAARDPHIDAVVAENPFADVDDLLDYGARDLPRPLRAGLAAVVRWRTYGSAPQPVDVVADIAPRPLLILHGRADEIVHYSQSEKLFAAAREPKTLWLAPDAEHTQVYDVHPAEYERRVLAFFEPLRDGEPRRERAGKS